MTKPAQCRARKGGPIVRDVLNVSTPRAMPPAIHAACGAWEPVENAINGLLCASPRQMTGAAEALDGGRLAMREAMRAAMWADMERGS